MNNRLNLQVISNAKQSIPDGIVHNEDHLPNKLMWYCPLLYHTTISNTFLDKEVFHILFFFSRAPFRLSPAVPVHECNGLRAGSGRRQAACEQGAACACGEDLVEVGRLSRIAIVSTRQLEQRRREGAHGGDS